MRVRVGGSWGFAATRGTDRGGRRGARSSARSRWRPRSPPSTERRWPPSRRPGARTRARWNAIRSRSRWRRSSACSPTADAGLRTTVDRRAHAWPAFRRCRVHKALRLDRGRALRAASDRVRRRPRGRWPSTATRARSAPTPPRTEGMSPRPATSTSSHSSLPLTRRALAEEASALLRAPACPAGRTTLILVRRTARASRSTSRSATRSSSTACSGARPPTRAPASCPPTPSARCATAPSR